VADPRRRKIDQHRRHSLDIGLAHVVIARRVDRPLRNTPGVDVLGQLAGAAGQGRKPPY